MKIFSSLHFTNIILLLTLISLCEAGFRVRRRRRSPPPPPNRAPTFTYCPTPWTERTTSMEKVVTWTTPTARDDYSNPVVTKTSGPSPGSSLRAGTYRVTYTAKDSHGATASCSFRFTVDVVRCPAILSSRHRWHSCTYGTQGGSECSFTCQRGYRLSDNATVRCNSDTRRWSASFPTCDVMTCTPPLTNPANGSVSCTDGNRFMSTCSYSCDDGYVIPSGQTSSRYCNGNVWSGSEPVCQGNRCPTFPTSDGRFHSCTDGTERGSQCTFSCQGGYVLNGGATVECSSRTLEWTNVFPTCQKLVCEPELNNPAYGLVSCSDENNFLSTCTYYCIDGFAVPNRQTSARFCNGQSWTGTEPTCRDIKAPEFTFCPDSFDVIINTDGSTNTETIIVNYDSPQAVDNSGRVTVRQTQGHPSGSHFSLGPTIIIYRAEDEAENTADCIFTINVMIRSSSK